MTAFDEFQKTVQKVPENPFLHIPLQATRDYGQSAVDYRYGEALEEINILSEQYKSAGYGHGQRVALVLDNRTEFFLHFQALNKLGVSVVPVNSGFRVEEMAYVIGHSDSCLVLSLPIYMEKVMEALATIDRPVSLVDTGGMDTLSQSSGTNLTNEVDGDTEAAVLYTSGTTGEPKGCMISNDYFVSIGQWYNSIHGYCQLSFGEERMLTPLPLVHMNALCTMMAMIMSGGCIIQLDRFHPSTWWETVRTSGATCLHYLGVIPAILLNQAENPEDNVGDQVKFGFGAGVDPKHLQRFEDRFGFKLVEGWAMTETGTHVSITTHEEPRHIGTRCVGKPVNAIEYRLVDEEGKDVATGEPGELLIRVAGDNPRKGFFSGYYKNEEETAKVWEGGYFHTGDVLRVSEDGSFHFVDRRKNIIRRSGENIAAVEVENVLFQSAEIANCAVTPVYDEMRGEEVGVCIILNEGAIANKETANRLFEFCSEKLVYYKIPAYYMFVPELPMTASQKLQRGEIKKLSADLIEQGKCIDLRKLKRKGK
ncbi:MAG: acyl-CoA synthetase (AMP-forming)/AMP-acid ligase II [Planctomycetota bacterium]|jgi:acyl-CoA synthetase (AMP-forming)/AMP-acid ligase II